MSGTPHEVIVLGAGGHAKVVVATLQACGVTVAGIYDDDPDKWGREVCGIPVHGPLHMAREKGHASVLLGIGDNATRCALARQFDGPWATAIHPSAVVHASAKIGVGSVVFAGAIIQPDCAIGEHAIINTGAIVDHDGRIADFAHLGSGACLAGDVSVGEGSLLGAGTVAMPGVSVGAWTVVGAGSAVIRSLPDAVTAVGAPARVIGRRTARQARVPRG